MSPFDFAGDKAVRHVRHSRAAIAADGGAEHAHGAHFVHDLTVEVLLAYSLETTQKSRPVGVANSRE